ncbi:MAG: ATP-binding protein [Solirubrobacteraceae bacterium]
MKPDMELALGARAENIAIVRHAFGGLGEVYGISDEKLSDIRLAVTEACSNVVVHAYSDHESAHFDPTSERRSSSAADLLEGASARSRRHGWGTMEVSATMVDEELAVVVRDWGEGIKPRPDSPGLGLGLSLMAALADTVQLGHDTTEHTEVRMTFLLSEQGVVPGEEPGMAAAVVASARPDALRRASDGQA